MGQNKTEKLRKLEETIDKLKVARIRAEERLSLLRQERDKLIKELAKENININDIQIKLTEMSDQIDADIKTIEDQIPPNLEELLNDKNNNTEV